MLPQALPWRLGLNTFVLQRALQSFPEQFNYELEALNRSLKDKFPFTGRIQSRFQLDHSTVQIFEAIT